MSEVFSTCLARSSLRVEGRLLMVLVAALAAGRGSLARYAVTPAVRLGLDYDVTRFKAHDTRGSMQTLGLSAQFAF